MVSPNFGLLQMGAGDFQNALAQGYQIGTDARQRREQTERRNALADVLLGGQSGIVATPEQQAQTSALEAAFPDAPRNGQQDTRAASMERLARLDPETYMQVQASERADTERRQRQQQADLGTMRQLLRRAGTSPEGWQQAVGAAQQMGLDLSGIPQQYDPQWAEQQLFIMDALSDPETATSVIRDVQALGLDPQSPEGQAAVQELTLFKYGKQTTDERGRPALALPTIQTGQQERQYAPQVGQVQDGYRFLGGDPADQNSWQQVMNAAPEISPQELNAMVQREGPQAVQARINRGEFTVRNY